MSYSLAWMPTVDEENKLLKDCELIIDTSLSNESFYLKENKIISGGEAGLMYGKYALLKAKRTGIKPDSSLQSPAAGFRVLNHWDDVSGRAERGYAGASLFFKDGDLCYDSERIRSYARLLASVRINAVSLNNVNVSPQAALLITEERLPKLARIAEIFREFHIKLIISVDFAAPKTIGSLDTYDPFEQKVIDWWANQTETVYRYIPDLAGFLVKADSEFRSGPAALGRSQADGANVIARALEKYGGVVFWRCFVYNCLQDWRDTKTDRPKAAVEHFNPLDGCFDKNVILQIKNGPSDFQVREPLSPLLGSMKQTRQALELQVTQEYTGQQIDLYALAVAWEEMFSSHLTKDRNLASYIGKEIDSISAVSNTGLDENWTGHPLAQANLFAYGCLAWNPLLTAEEILAEWIKLTFGKDIYALKSMMINSCGTYEKYTSPLGIGWMVNISHHYGPSVDGYEYMRWGTYHRANHKSIGVDRTKDGTAFTSQYDPWLAGLYDDIKTCPEELLLYFHRLDFSYMLKSGKTVIQHIYDSHFEGAQEVENFIKIWDSIEKDIPAEVFKQVCERLQRQLVNAYEWRDVVNTYFCRLTAVPDEHNRKIYE